MEKRQNTNIWSTLRIYIYVLCGTFGFMFSICDALQFSYRGNEKTAWAAGVIAVLGTGAVLTFQKKKGKIAAVIFWAGIAVAAFIYRDVLVKETGALWKELVLLAGRYYSASVGAWIIEPYAGRDISIGLIVPSAVAAVILSGVWGKKKCKVIGYIFLGVCFLLPFLMGGMSNVEGILMLMVCAAGMQNGTGAGVWKRDAAAVMVLVAAFGIGQIFLAEPIEKYVKNPGTLREDFTKVLSARGKAKGGVSAGGVGTHRELVQGDEVQLRLRADEVPSADIYLKGYIGGKYRPQKWDRVDMSGLESKVGKSLEELQNAPYEKLLDAGTVSWTLTVEEVEVNPLYAYYPYYSSYEGVKFDGDGYAKGRKEKEYTIEYCNLWSLSYMNTELWEERYHEFVREQYLEVPDNVREELQEIADEVSGSSLEEVLNNIRQYLSRNAEYTLSPGRTPYGKDTVLYFLNENQRGYCVHFATAAAVLLRMNDIPARFVSGYLVKKKEFLHSGDGTGVAAKVTGKNAHAWAEYYVEGFGWIPFDATPSFGSSTHESDGLAENLQNVVQGNEGDSDDNQTESDTNASEKDAENADPDENVQGNDEAGKSSENVSENASENESGNESGNVSVNKDGIAGTGGIGGHGTEGPDQVKVRMKIKTTATAIFLILCILILALSGFLIRRNVQRRKKYGTEKSTNARVQQMFYFFYEMILYLGFPEEMDLQSAGFLMQFGRQFPSVSEEEAALFMEIAERANYGGREISREEEKFVEIIYRKVRADGLQNISIGKKIWMKIWKFY